MDTPNLLDSMRADWNRRAAEDANYYVAFGRHQQSDEEFFSTGAGTVQLLAAELKRFTGRDAALEIGCGPGRLMRPLSRYFKEIHGVDISDEMIRLARERLAHTANAFLQQCPGSDLSMFPDAKFDFVYSYAVFQHIPSRDVVFAYLREAFRVLKPGGFLRCQLNGMPAHAHQYDTWSGVRITPAEITEFVPSSGFHLLALEQVWTQYMWITLRKPGPESEAPAARAARLHNISNALTGEAVTPVSGAMAALALWIERLPASCHLLNTAVTADGRPCRLTCISPPAADGVSQVNAVLPENLRTGLVLVEAVHAGAPLCSPGWVRIVPAGPAVPRVTAVSDGINLLSGNRIVTGTVKVTMEEVPRGAAFRATVDKLPTPAADAFCTDPVAQRWNFDFHLPENLAPGSHKLSITLGRRAFPPVPIEVA
ncbi:MAG: class I SAM-dependent methyltransferase [Bryobacteraceae bacterium]|jgi:SAM-dependent methyltransferase